MNSKLFFSAVSLALWSMTGLAAAGDTAAPPAQSAASAAPLAQAPGYYRFRLGEFRVTVLSDGTAKRDLPKIMSNPDQVRREFAASHQTLPVELSINCFLIDTGSRRILVDTGAGELFGAGAGRIVANLRAAGYQPEAIDAILLTHIHGDHSGGLSVKGQRLFPNAVLRVDRRDADYWLPPAHEAEAPADRRLSFQQARQTVGPYVEAGKLQPFDGPTQLYPGVRSVAEHGHTPGLSGYLIESGGERLLLWGDIVHAAEAQFRDPSLTIQYDVDAPAAIAARKRILADAASQGYLVGGAHLSFPGLGHVRAEQAGYSWVPAPWSQGD